MVKIGPGLLRKLDPALRDMVLAGQKRRGSSWLEDLDSGFLIVSWITDKNGDPTSEVKAECMVKYRFVNLTICEKKREMQC